VVLAVLLLKTTYQALGDGWLHPYLLAVAALLHKVFGFVFRKEEKYVNY
jgi:uncharacterized membrane protein